MSRRFLAITTFNETGKEVYGKNFVHSFDNYWCGDISLVLYYEGHPAECDDIRCSRHWFRIVSLEDSCPDLVRFKLRNWERNRSSHRPGKRSDMRWDAIRFSHKVYAITHAGLTYSKMYDVLLWLDADIKTFEHISPDYMESLLPENCYCAYIGRDTQKGAETGIIAFNLKHPINTTFMQEYQDVYNSDRVFDEYKQWHDGYVFANLINKFEEEHNVVNHDYSANIPSVTHPFVNVFGTHMDHLKGDRADRGHSRIRDFINNEPPDHPYWGKVQLYFLSRDERRVLKQRGRIRKNKKRQKRREKMKTQTERRKREIAKRGGNTEQQ